MPLRWDARADKNQKDIVDAARKMGCSAVPLFRLGQGVGDYLLGYHGHNLLIEIKTDEGKLTKAEQHFFDTWYGQVTVIRSIEDLRNLLAAYAEYRVP